MCGFDYAPFAAGAPADLVILFKARTWTELHGPPAIGPHRHPRW
jgi:GH43 family beta-xylosidase